MVIAQDEGSHNHGRIPTGTLGKCQLIEIRGQSWQMDCLSENYKFRRDESNFCHTKACMRCARLQSPTCRDPLSSFQSISTDIDAYSCSPWALRSYHIIHSCISRCLFISKNVAMTRHSGCIGEKVILLKTALSVRDQRPGSLIT